jgi:uncharacterized protein (TIGR03086 family)
MDPLVTHQRSLDLFAAVLGRIGPDQLEEPTPCEQWKVRDVVGHAISGNCRVANVPPPEATDLMSFVEAFSASARAAQDVFGAPGGLERSFEMPFAAVPGSVMVRMRATDLTAHAWDLARATGQPTDLDPELAEELLASARQTLQPSFRGPGRPFAEEQPCDPARPAADRLAAFLGRRVD